MMCTTDDIGCELARLVETLNSWDWNAFWSTVVATLFGAAISGFLAWLLFRGDRAARYNESLDNALQRFVEAVGKHLDELIKYKLDQIKITQSTAAVVHAIFQPITFALNIAANHVAMLARGKDEPIAIALRESISRIEQERIDTQMAALSQVTATIAEWRSGRWTREQTANELGALPGSLLNPTEQESPTINPDPEDP
ncbi:hypothetical protein [Leifsonia poae]|uniref:hypothetical protein n=1 Tax=Leifsonia poae TaxID=110933 RepID=UPI003D67F647